MSELPLMRSDCRFLSPVRPSDEVLDRVIHRTIAGFSMNGSWFGAVDQRIGSC